MTTTHYEKVCSLSRENSTKQNLISTVFKYVQEMNRLHRLIDAMNRNTFNPVGLNIVWPKTVGFLFVSDKPPVVDAARH